MLAAIDALVTPFLKLGIVSLLVALTFWQKSLFLYALMCPVCIVYGLSLTAGELTSSPLWMAGIAVAIIGTYCLFKVVLLGLEGTKVRRK